MLTNLDILVPELVDEDGDGVEGVVRGALRGRGHDGDGGGGGGVKGRAGSGSGSLLGVESDEVGILSQAAAFAIHSDQQKIRRLR